MGIDEILTTPKYHAEISGEGIEYAWGVAKSMYRKIKLSHKKYCLMQFFIVGLAPLVYIYTELQPHTKLR